MSESTINLPRQNTSTPISRNALSLVGFLPHSENRNVLMYPLNQGLGGTFVWALKQGEEWLITLGEKPLYEGVPSLPFNTMERLQAFVELWLDKPVHWNFKEMQSVAQILIHELGFECPVSVRGGLYKILGDLTVQVNIAPGRLNVSFANLGVWEVEQFYNKLVKGGEATIGFVVVEIENGQPVKPHLLKDFVSYL